MRQEVDNRRSDGMGEIYPTPSCREGGGGEITSGIKQSSDLLSILRNKRNRRKRILKLF